MVILCTEISFSTAVRVLFSNTKMVIFLYILANNHHNNVCAGVRLGQDNMISKSKNLPYALPCLPMNKNVYLDAQKQRKRKVKQEENRTNVNKKGFSLSPFKGR